MRNDGTRRAAGGLPPTLYAGTPGGRMADATRGMGLELDSDEARHARSLRLGGGDEVLVTDGAGARGLARVEDPGRREVRCTLLEPWPAAPPLSLSVWAPVGNKDGSLWLVEKATELGVSEIRFIECERSLSVADAGRSTGFLDRARRRAVAALKQGGGAAVWFVGPEGGLTAAEREGCLDAGFEPVSLGPRTLRFETAAVAEVATLAAALDSGRREGGARRARKDELGGTG